MRKRGEPVHQTTTQRESRILCLAKWRLGDAVRIPAAAVKPDFTMRFYLNTENTDVGNQNDKVDLGATIIVVWRKIE
ncbi:hypothetical protein D3C78_1760370 [compost metagenome]